MDYSGVFSQPLINSDFAFQAQQAMNLAVTRDLEGSQIRKNNAETAESLNRGVLYGAKTKFAEEYAVEELRSMRLQNDKVYKDCQVLDQTVNNLIATRNLTKEQIDSLRYANEFADRTMEYRIESTQLANAETRKRMREIDSRINKNSAEVKMIFENIRSAVINNSYLPSLLQNNFDKGIQEIRNLRKTEKSIQAGIDNIATETGLNKIQLANWFWLNAPAMSKIPGATIGAGSDISNRSLNYIPNY